MFEVLRSRLETNPLNILLHLVIKEYLLDSYCLTIVSEESMTLKINLPFTYIVPRADRSVEELTAQLLDVSEQGCSDYLVHVTNHTQFMIAFDKVAKLGQNRRGDRKIIFVSATKETCHEVMAMKETSFVANVLFILGEIENECETFSLMTHEFMKSEGDELIILDKWNSCTGTFIRNANLFPHDIRDLKGKVLKVAAFGYPPFTIFDLDEAISPTGMDGIEIRIVEEFCRWLNCTLDVIRDESDAWGSLTEPGEGTGILGDMVRDQADIGISGFYIWYEMSLQLDFSASYMQSTIWCVAPSPSLISGWSVPLLPFSRGVWGTLVLALAAAGAGLALAQPTPLYHAIFTVYAIFICQSVRMRGRGCARVVAACAVCAGVVVGSAYGAGLAAALALPRHEPTVDTARDLAAARLPWAAPHEAWVYSLQLSPDPLMKELVTLFRVFPPEELERRSYTRDLAFSLERMSSAGEFAVPAYLSADALAGLTLMAEPLYYGECMSLFRKGSPYRDRMDTLVGTLHQAGLLLAWETQISLKYMDFQKQEIVRLSRSRNEVGEVQPIRLWNMTGAFAALVLGAALAGAAFAGELLTHRVTRNPITATYIE